MRVAMLSDFETTGGAAIAASRLATGLAQAGHEVVRLVHEPDGATHLWKTVPVSADLAVFEKAAARVLGPAWRNSRKQIQSSKDLNTCLNEMNPDIINIHNLHSAFPDWNINMVEICNTHAPVAWTLHDMWSFTGRCAYSYDCRAFPTLCDHHCPTPNEYPELRPDLIAEAWSYKKDLLKRCARTVAVCPSRWLSGEAQLGHWAGKQIEVIPNGLPLDIYEPADRAQARKALSVDPSGPVFLMSAQVLSERRKGAFLLVPALGKMKKRPITLLTIGMEAEFPEIPGVTYHHLGHINEERKVALAYSAADLVVHPAPVDNLPNGVVEAIACGTPVVAFETGGIPEVVRANITGWLAPEITPDSLARAMDAAIEEIQKGNTLRESSRSIAAAEYSQFLQASRYEKLFESLTR